MHTVSCMQHVTSGQYGINSVQLQHLIHGTHQRPVLCVPDGQVQGYDWELCLRRLHGRQVLCCYRSEQLCDLSKLPSQIVRQPPLQLCVHTVSCTQHVPSGQQRYHKLHVQHGVQWYSRP